MNDLEHIAGLDAIQAEINRLSLQAFERLIRLIDDGKAPRDAIAEVQTAFVGDYEAGLLQAFNRILVTSIGTTELRQLKIGDLSLSQRLYQHSRDVQATALSVINNHAQGFHDARKLALQLYEGYQFRPKEPLAIRAPLPKYLRAAFGDDEAFKALWKHEYVGSKLAGLADYVEIGPELARLYANIKASNLKTPALKAAYLQAIQALEDGRGKEVLSKVLKTAFHERNRYFTNRIAQTELHRAYTDQVAAEIMADDGIQYVEYRMSQTHPKSDICDMFARMDKYGLGPGVYPKAHAPKPPLHPFCRCKTSPRAWVDGSQRLRPAAERNFLDSLPTHEARQIMGSADRLAQMRAGKSVDDVLNAGRAEMYHLKRLGEFGKGNVTAPLLQQALDAKLDEMKTMTPVIPVKWRGKVDVAFKDEVKAAIKSLPINVLSRLESEGCTIEACRRIVTAFPELKGVTPRVWPSNKTWDNADGFARGSKIVVAEEYKFFKKYYKSNRVGGVFRHEAGHVLDRALGEASSTLEYMQAYIEDSDFLKQQTGYEIFNYLLQEGAAGRQESFAEIFAQLHGSGSAAYDAIKAFPKTTEVIRKMIKEA